MTWVKGQCKYHEYSIRCKDGLRLQGVMDFVWVSELQTLKPEDDYMIKADCCFLASKLIHKQGKS